MPADVDVELLDRSILGELRALPPVTADRVAGHLAAAAVLLDEDSEMALAHARVARRLAARVGVVRETTGIAAYRAGEYAEALAELRAARRIGGSAAMLPVIADCERALGRPARALELARDPAVRELDATAQVEMRIVESGARRDLGEYDAAVLALERLARSAVAGQPWSARLAYAYAAALLAAGRVDDARRWFAAAVEADDAAETDAAEQLADLSEPPPGQ